MTSRSLEWKPQKEQVRVIYTSAAPECMREHDGKVFAVLGPFDNFADKHDFRLALETLVRGWNIEVVSD
jgi:hypothetical protein